MIFKSNYIEISKKFLIEIEIIEYFTQSNFLNFYFEFINHNHLQFWISKKKVFILLFSTQKNKTNKNINQNNKKGNGVPTITTTTIEPNSHALQKTPSRQSSTSELKSENNGQKAVSVFLKVGEDVR